MEVEKELSIDFDITDIIASKIAQRVAPMLGCVPTTNSSKPLSNYGRKRAKQIKAEEKEKEVREERIKNLVSKFSGSL